MVKIMVVPRRILFSEGRFQGFSDKNIGEMLEKIKKNHFFIEREKAEHDPKLKQPIPYCVLCNEDNKIFAYKRASKKQHYFETRLHGKWSFGVGGHIEEEDAIDGKDPIITALKRELMEEVNLEVSLEDVKILGFINNDLNSVGRVHFGILCLVRIPSKEIHTNKEIVSSGTFNLEELKTLSEKTNMEAWSQIALPVLEKVLKG